MSGFGPNPDQDRNNKKTHQKLMTKRCFPPESPRSGDRVACGGEQMGESLDFVRFSWVIAHPLLPEPAKISRICLRSGLAAIDTMEPTV